MSDTEDIDIHPLSATPSSESSKEGDSPSKTTDPYSKPLPILKPQCRNLKRVSPDSGYESQSTTPNKRPRFTLPPAPSEPLKIRFPTTPSIPTSTEPIEKDKNKPLDTAPNVLALLSVARPIRDSYYDYWFRINRVRGVESILKLGRITHGQIQDFSITIVPKWDRGRDIASIHALLNSNEQVAQEAVQILQDASRWALCGCAMSLGDERTVMTPSDDVRFAVVSRAKLVMVLWMMENAYWIDMAADEPVPFGVAFTGKFLEPLRSLDTYTHGSKEARKEAKHWPFRRSSKRSRRGRKGEKYHVSIGTRREPHFEGTIRKTINRDVSTALGWMLEYKVVFRERVSKRAGEGEEKGAFQWDLDLGYGEPWMWTKPLKSRARKA